MIEFEMSRTRICFDFSFFAVISVFIIFVNDGYLFEGIIACTVHELSHLAAMRACGVVAEKLLFYGAGICICNSSVGLLSFAKKLIIYSVGCFANIVLFLIMLVMGNEDAAAVNLLMAMFNLLPIGELDGASILNTLLVRFAPADKVDAVLSMVELIVIALICAVTIFLSGGINLLSVAVLIYFCIIGKLPFRKYDCF